MALFNAFAKNARGNRRYFQVESIDVAPLPHGTNESELTLNTWTHDPELGCMVPDKMITALHADNLGAFAAAVNNRQGPALDLTTYGQQKMLHALDENDGFNRFVAEHIQPPRS